jgi:hypothetical protein
MRKILHEAFTTGDINSLAYRIIEEIVGITTNINLRRGLACDRCSEFELKVELHAARWLRCNSLAEKG